MTRPRLAIAMIVRDEAEMLPGFLDGVAGLWDELVAVDTGSTDETVALLEAAGARVSKRAWDDDFAAARNASLDRVTAEWVLVLDADERPTMELREQIRAVLDVPGAGAASVVMRNRLPFGHHREARLLRMFRREQTIRYQHRIHEDAAVSVRAWLQRTGRKLVHLDGVVDHLGYVREVAAARGKKDRDLRLIARALAEAPDDLYLHFKRLEIVRFWGDLELGVEAAREADAAIQRVGREAVGRQHFAGSLVVSLLESLHAADEAAMLAALDAWEDVLDPSAAYHLRRGESRERLGHGEAARLEFQRALAATDAAGSWEIAPVRPRLALARLALARGDVGDATRRIDEALAMSPRDPEALLGRITLARLEGGDALDAFVATHREAHGPVPELDQVLGEEALRTGRSDEAILHLSRAAGDAPEGRLALGLAQALLMNGRAEAAHDLAMELLGELPEAGIGMLVANLALGRNTALELELELEDANLAMREWTDVVLRCQDLPLAERFLENVPSVLDVFPWMVDHLRARLGDPVEGA